MSLDRSIENALRLVIGENWGNRGYNRGRHYQILTPNELDLSFPALNDCAKFRQILFKIATVGEMTHRQTDTSDLIICPMLCYSNGTDSD